MLAYKDKSERARGLRERSSLTLEDICGLEPGLPYEGLAHTLAIVCLSQAIMLGFDSREAMCAWDARIRYALGEVHRFHVTVAPGTKLESGPATLHLCNDILVLARDIPPAVMGQWKLSDLRRYGAVPNGFIFEGGTRCGYWAGVFFLSSAEGEQISFLFDCIVRGISPTKGPFGLRPAPPDPSPGGPSALEERVAQEALEALQLEKRLSLLSHSGRPGSGGPGGGAAGDVGGHTSTGGPSGRLGARQRGQATETAPGNEAVRPSPAPSEPWEAGGPHAGSPLALFSACPVCGGLKRRALEGRALGSQSPEAQRLRFLLLTLAQRPGCWGQAGTAALTAGPCSGVPRPRARGSRSGFPKQPLFHPSGSLGSACPALRKPAGSLLSLPAGTKSHTGGGSRPCPRGRRPQAQPPGLGAPCSVPLRRRRGRRPPTLDPWQACLAPSGGAAASPPGHVTTSSGSPGLRVEAPAYVNIPASPSSKKQLHYLGLELPEAGAGVRGTGASRYAQIDITATETAHRVGALHVQAREQRLSELEQRRKGAPQ
ncbi:LOW QUALITY PROTEIN: protein Dok-7 [Carlito syrichta]|uniref:LOW QUALITY PROTEIN: protein Dok-7 n=1 Tax=Carlito syrichta TaxID=1868482 RepID=A0A3Q0E592_CARSF|nr:LOW QUALITY PROTEIN: protein Dok-7 [Carlito syrichta]